MQSTEYRPDIQGLRAIAVLGVIAFHLGLPGVAGGYVGVDVFFVISGYLITGNIRRSLSAPGMTAGKFLADFYGRRVRRILPALLATIAVSIAVGAWLMAPGEMLRLGGAAISSALSVSNYFFWSESGYWDASSITKPLLHTWSLSAEEQFYFVWPALFLGLSKLGARVSLIVVIFVGLASLVAAELYRPIDAAAVFFWTPFRVSEFAIGALLTWLPNHRPPRVVEELGTFIGIAAILIAIALYNENSAVPGFASLVPCGGAAMIIWCGRARFFGRALSNPVSHYIGTTSYSLYLAHWPVIVFWTVFVFRPHEWSDIAVMAVLTGVAGLVLYYAVERPLRHAKWKRSAYATATIAMIVAIIVPSASAMNSGGWTWRVAESVRAVAEDNASFGLVRWAQAVRAGTCHLASSEKEIDAFFKAQAACHPVAKGAIVVVGDSHAADVYLALSHGQDRPVAQFTGGGCSALHVGDPCARMMEAGRRFALDHASEITALVYAQRGPASGQATTGIRKWLRSIAKRGVFTVWAGPHNEYQPDIPAILARSLTLDHAEDLALSRQSKSIMKADQRLAASLDGSPIHYLSVVRTLCPRKRCPLFDESGNLLIIDYGHWTVAGAKHFGPILARRLDRLLTQP